jgi:hypothetical protein
MRWSSNIIDTINPFKGTDFPLGWKTGQQGNWSVGLL